LRNRISGAEFIAGGAPLADRPFADGFESLVQAP
jgi:hypothetical protein